MLIEFPIEIFLAFSILNLLWWLGLSRPILQYQDPKFSGDVFTGCSILVIYRNEKDNLPGLLKSLNKQNYPSTLELVLVDDHSNDSGKDFVDGFRFKKNIEVKSLRLEGQGEGISSKKNAIAYGIKNAKYDRVLLIDADCYASSENWIINLDAALQSRPIVLGLSNYENTPGLLNQFVQFDTLMTGLQFFGWGLLGYPYMALGRNWGYRKEKFQEAGGFKNISNFKGGDDDLLLQQFDRRGNITFLLSSASRTISKPPETWPAWRSQKVRHLNSSVGYKTWAKVLSLTTLTNHFFLLALAGLLIIPEGDLSLAWPWIAARYLVILSLVILLQRKIGNKVAPILYPFIEPFYWLFHLAAFFASLSTSDPKWKEKENFQVRP